MDNNFQGLNVVAVIIAGAGVGKLLAGRSRWLRWFASFIAAAGVGGMLGYAEGYIGSYGERHDPAATQLALEKEFERLAPALIPIVKQEDPQAWREFMSRASQQVAASGGNPSEEDTRKLGIELRVLTKTVWHSVSKADDAAILALARQDIVVDETLERETTSMCDSRGAPLWNLNDLPPASLKAVQNLMALMSIAYRQGKGRQQGLLTDDDAAGLMREAISWKGAPFSDDDVTYFTSGSNTDPGRQCRVRLQFEKNVMSIPEHTALFRWLYAHTVE